MELDYIVQGFDFFLGIDVQQMKSVLDFPDVEEVSRRFRQRSLALKNDDAKRTYLNAFATEIRLRYYSYEIEDDEKRLSEESKKNREELVYYVTGGLPLSTTIPIAMMMGFLIGGIVNNKF